tara:strand:- start:5529 stop:6014 length:486 start_codon:yes stop_codon:yes gene_type:complete
MSSNRKNAKQRKTTTTKTKAQPRKLKQQNAKKPGKRFSRAQAVNTMELMVLNGLMTRKQMTEKLAKLDAKQALTDGTRSKDVTTQKCFDVSRKAIKAVRNASKAPSTSAYVDASGKMVIVYVTTAREGSSKYASLAKSEYKNDVRLAMLHNKKREAKQNAK